MSKKQIKRELDIKVVLLGESGVGKSCIILRFSNDIYSQVSLSTILCSHTSKPISFNNKKDIINFNIWDTAGQEKFRSISKIHYKDAEVIILVFDITREKSFESIKEYWYPQVKENAPENAILALVASKCDLKDECSVDIDDARSYAEEINAMFKETSSKASFGINELFEEIGKKILSYDDFKGMIFKKNKTITDENTSDDDENTDKTNETKEIKLEINKIKKNQKRCC